MTAKKIVELADAAERARIIRIGFRRSEWPWVRSVLEAIGVKFYRPPARGMPPTTNGAASLVRITQTSGTTGTRTLGSD